MEDDNNAIVECDKTIIGACIGLGEDDLCLLCAHSLTSR